MKRLPPYLWSALVLVLVVAAFFLGRYGPPAKAPATSPAAAPADGERDVLYWYDPMVPDQHFDEPGPSPFMDMALVPRYADEVSGGSLQVTPELRASLGIRSEAVRRGSFWQRVDTFGEVITNADSLHAVQARFDGWIEAARVSARGEAVRRGDTLLEIFSPEIVAAAEELRLAQRRNDDGLLAAARRRLQSLGLTAAQRRALEAGRLDPRHLPLAAPVDGHIHALQAVPGQRVQAGDTLVMLADDRTVWVQASLPEQQAGWVTAGRPATLRFSALPGEEWEATVDLLAPVLDRTTGTLDLRLRLPNPGMRLRPGMRATVTLWGGARPDVLLVPSAAVIRDGRGARVVLDEGESGFRVAEVRIDADNGDIAQVGSGLQEGERVVVSGQFLLDSEASLRRLPRRLAAAETQADGGRAHRHGADPASTGAR